MIKKTERKGWDYDFRVSEVTPRARAILDKVQKNIQEKQYADVAWDLAELYKLKDTVDGAKDWNKALDDAKAAIDDHNRREKLRGQLTEVSYKEDISKREQILRGRSKKITRGFINDSDEKRSLSLNEDYAITLQPHEMAVIRGLEVFVYAFDVDKVDKDKKIIDEINKNFDPQKAAPLKAYMKFEIKDEEQRKADKKRRKKDEREYAVRQEVTNGFVEDRDLVGFEISTDSNDKITGIAEVSLVRKRRVGFNRDEEENVEKASLDVKPESFIWILWESLGELAERKLVSDKTNALLEWLGKDKNRAAQWFKRIMPLDVAEKLEEKLGNDWHKKINGIHNARKAGKLREALGEAMKEAPSVFKKSENEASLLNGATANTGGVIFDSAHNIVGLMGDKGFVKAEKGK